MTLAHVVSDPAADLRARWARARHDQPGLRARDAARQLGVSEAALIASRVGEDAVRLDGDLADLVRGLPAVGEVMVLTRNESCVHEKVGRFDHVEIFPGAGMVLNHDIDLRLFMQHWRHAFAVKDTLADGAVRRSLQVFDGEGEAVHKVFARETTDLAAWDALVAAFTAADQTDGFTPTAYPDAPVDRPDAEIDVAGLRANWEALQDTHDFFGLLKDFHVGRQQAFRLVGEPFAQTVSNTAMRVLLERAAERALPIMVFVGNRGCIQIHTGPVETIKVMGPWLNVLDKGFNLHLREDAIAASWVVRKPTRDGWVTSLELFDAEGRNFAMVFGERKPKQAELETWRALCAELETLA
ncbi:MAG TPA: ChuX/HutX family heme-like substrate-binding protein [Brevundimonas sp.]|jgi:putative hemin transport protein|uniref:hemin-degrading factor n=1 Tax=Brevundimonas sp. TaxID=1871086 RepID=UPI002E0D4B39|nr:ChuX/HutX family heme-like substrate-binding protein [Brevundimonas sp.]